MESPGTELLGALSSVANDCRGRCRCRRNSGKHLALIKVVFAFLVTYIRQT